MRIEDARNQYVRWLLATKDLSPHTVRAYVHDIAALERQLGEAATLDQVDSDCLFRLLEGAREDGLSPRTIRRRASGVRGFCRWLVSNDLLASDPWAGTPIPSGRGRVLPRIVATHHLHRLFQYLRDAAAVESPSELRCPLKRPHETTTLLGVALMVATGVRVNELVSIDCEAVDLREGSLRLVGKGRRERHVFLTNAWLIQLTNAYLETREGLSPHHSRLLFDRRLGPLSSASMRSRLVKASHEAGIGRRITPHMLRHTAATQLIEAGVDIRYIQRLLGHASLSTTELYTHVSDRALRRVVSDADVLRQLVHQ